MSFAPEKEEHSTEAETSKKSKKGPVWKRKNLVIEQINELIDELDEIDGNIALQVGSVIARVLQLPLLGYTVCICTCIWTLCRACATL